MILYHGSNISIQNIDLQKCRPFKDFGKGFYLTDIKQQAVFMAERVSKMSGGTTVLNIYSIDDDFMNSAELHIMDFSSIPSEEWALFVMNNRNRYNDDIGNALCNTDNKYDIVHGPVADDAMAVLFQQYEHHYITLDMLKNGLTYRQLSMQYSFHSERALALLTKTGVEKWT